MSDHYTGRVPRTDQIEACDGKTSADPWISVIVTGDDECTINVVQDSNAATVRYKSLFFLPSKQIFKRHPLRSQNLFLLFADG